ncbi:MAG TPA: HAD hydrolase-like protein [Chitinivibrionales bacterium]|nr:HAD hydrolase-like protein [Chitinivibrionales bacterium]
MNIILDLDGTLIDAKRRLFTLFCDLTKQTLLAIDDYWELKRAMYDNSYILKNYFSYSEAEIGAFNRKWLDQIEESNYLRLDTMFPFTIDVLDKLLQQDINLLMITARQFKPNTLQEINRFAIAKFFSAIFVTEGHKTKEELLRSSGLEFHSEDLLVGDTGIDIQTGKSLNVRTFAVLSGFRNRSMQLKYRPDFIADDMRNIVEVLK